MRIALTAAMLMAAGIAWADEPPAAEAQAEAAATEAPAAEPAATKDAAAATEATTSETAATESTAADASATEESTAAEEKDDDKPFKVPPGYRSKTIGGKQMYCKSVVTSGSRFGKEQCRTEAQLRAIERQKTAAPPLSNPSCSGTCATR